MCFVIKSSTFSDWKFDLFVNFHNVVRLYLYCSFSILITRSGDFPFSIILTKFSTSSNCISCSVSSCRLFDFPYLPHYFLHYLKQTLNIFLHLSMLCAFSYKPFSFFIFYYVKVSVNSQYLNYFNKKILYCIKLIRFPRDKIRKMFFLTCCDRVNIFRFIQLLLFW